MTLHFRPLKNIIIGSFAKIILICTFILTSVFSEAQSVSICEGSTDFLVNPNPGGTWVSSDPTICTVDLNSGEITAIAQGFCTVTYTDLTLAATPFSITVDEIVTLSPITGASSICLNASNNLSTLSTGGVWSSSDPSILLSNGGGNITGNGPGVTTINYTKTNGSCQAIETFTVTVVDIPAVNPIIEFADICVGSTFGFVNSTPNGNWSTSNDLIATMDNLGFATGVAYGSVTIKYTVSVDGCTNFSSVTINVIPPSTLDLTSAVESDSQTVCLTNTIEEISFLMSGSGSNIHIVNGSFPNGVTGTYLNGVYTINGTPLQSGVFYITLETYGSLCDFEASKVVYLKVDVPPVVDFTYTINGLNVIFTNTTTNSDLAYVWDFGPGNSILANPTYTFPNFGSYTVSLTSQNNCGSSTISHVLGIDGLSTLNLIGYKMFPNPFTNELNLEFKSAEKTEIIITDLIGKVLYTKEFTQDLITLNLEEFTTGQYFLMINQNSRSQIEKIVKR